MQAVSHTDRALLRGMAWTALLRWASQIISWIGTFYVARILAPADYGVVALASVALGYARMVEDFGLDSILLQDRSIQGEAQSALAGLLLLTGVVLCLAYEALAVPISLLLAEPLTAWIIAVLALLFITDALQVIPRALLQRDLAFGRLAVLAFIQVLATQGALVLAARAGMGYRSLVFNNLSGAIVVTLILLWWRPVKFAWPRDFSPLARPMLQGWRMLVSRIGYYAYNTTDQLIIGRVLGKSALGEYSFAQTLSITAIQEVNSVVSKVVPGIFSIVQERRDELKRYFLTLTELVAYLALPMSVGIAVTADQLVTLALGPGWEGVVAPLRILCFSTAFSSAQMLISPIIVWTGHFRAQMWCTLLAAFAMPVAYWFGAKAGVVGVAWMWSVVFPIVNVPALVIAFRIAGIRWAEWLDTLYPAAVGSAVMAGAVLLVRGALSPDHSLFVACGIAVGSGVLVYGATLLGLFRRRLLDMLRFVTALRA
jgi:teichuronic acid exporter